MKRSEKKGFTIVELVIVIAVIAILAAVLIPNLSKLVTNANETADTMLIKELNTALDLDLERHETMYDALVAVERAGFIVSRINASVAGNEILWDSVNDCFVYLKGNEIVYQANREETPVDRSKKYLYWRIYESLPTEQTYSIYLNNETYNAETSVTVGFDAGRNKNAFAVNYTGTGTAQKVILRTDGQNLTVNAGQDTVNHYGATRTLTVTAVATSDCYHEHGFVGTLASFGNGKLVAYRGAQYHQTKAEVENAVGTNPKDLDKATFGQHYYQEGKCIICNDGGTSTVKTGLVDGYYYGEDGNLFTGSVEQDGKSYKFENGRIVITDDVSYTWKKKSGYTYYGGYYEVVHSIAVDVPESLLTDEIYVDTTAEIANNPGQAFKQVLSASENYVISKVALSSPDFGDGVIVGTSDQLSTIIKGWTKDDLKKYREMDESNTQTIPYIVRSADFVDYLQEVFPNESVTDATKMYMEAFGNNTLTKTYTEYLTNKYGAFNSWTYAKAVDFIKADGDCIEINNNEQQQVEPQLVEFLLKIFHLAAYNDSYVGVYNNDDSVVNGKSIGNFDGVNYSSVFYTYQGYSSLLSYENKNGISAIEIITPGVANCWNGVDVNSPSMRIVLTKK